MSLLPPSARRMIWALLCLTAWACNDDDSSGRLVGSLVVPECVGGEARRYECEDTSSLECEAFSLEPDFFSLELSDERAVIRIQRGGRPFSEVNGFLLDVRDVRALRGQLEVPFAFGPEENIRAALGLFESCPGSTQSFTLRGEVRFSHFGLKRGDRVTGELLWIEVRDGRDDAQPLGQLRGDFDFVIQRGPPYETFPGAGAR